MFDKGVANVKDAIYPVLRSKHFSIQTSIIEDY